MHPIVADFWDLTGAFLLFPLVIVVPGVVLVRISKLFDTQDSKAKWSIGLLVSIAVCPAVYYFLVRFGGFSAAWGFLGICWAAGLFFVYVDRAAVRSFLLYPVKHPKAALLFGVFYLLTAALLIDFEADGRLVRPLMSHDFVKHVAVTDAISRTGVPTANPSFYPGQSIPLFYYYFWFLLCSLVDLLGGSLVGPRGAVNASVLWCGIALAALVRFYLKAFGDRLFRGLERRHFVYAYTLLLVTGLDILPIVAEFFIRQDSLNEPLLPDILWWNEQVASWMSSVLWTPHHVAAFISCMTAFYLVVEHKPVSTREGKTAVGFIALTLVSALGMSIWIALVAGAILIAWLLVTWKRSWLGETGFLLLTGCLALALSIPYVLELQAANHLHRFPIAFEVRTFYKLDYFLHGAHPLVISLARLLVLPFNYGLELGFFALGGWIYWEYRKKLEVKLDRSELFLLVVLLTSTGVCTFVRSAVVNNDLGWRGFMFAQFVLLLYSIPLLARLRDAFADSRLQIAPATRIVVLATLVLSTAMLVFQAYVMRFHAWGPDHPDTAAIRAAYEWQDDHLLVDAVIQHNPSDNIEYFHALYGNRQVSVSDQLYGMLYGVNEALFDSTFTPLEALFLPGLTSSEGLERMQLLNLDGIFMKRTDPLWNDSTSWLAPHTPVYTSECCRIYTLESMQK